MRHRTLGMIVLLAGCYASPSAVPPNPSPIAGVGAGAGLGGTLVAGATGTSSAGVSMPAGVFGCEVADKTMPPAALHAAAAMALTGLSCGGSSSCHQGAGKAGLVLLGATNLRTLLVGKASCEASSVPLVTDGGGNAALQTSWLWLKLVAPIAVDNSLIPDPAWGQGGKACGQRSATAFGVRMPETTFASVAELNADTSHVPQVRNWICAGAPGP